jgi:flagella basal body P-ring formation protein FlgA
MTLIKIAGQMLLSAIISNNTYAADINSLPRQDMQLARKFIDDFLIVQTKGLQGKVTINVSQIDQRISMPKCDSLAARLPGNGKLIGKLSVSISCISPSNWTMYVPANVGLIADYVTANQSIQQGQIISETDLLKLNGDVSGFQDGTFNNTENIVGKIAAMRIQAGLPIRKEYLKQVLAIQIGQPVKINAIGKEFSVSTDGTALTNANDGQIVSAKTSSGQKITGTARTGGIVEISY